MTNETDEWKAAFIIAEQFGPEGVDFATQMAESFRIGGKMEEHRSWMSIVKKVDDLTTPAAEVEVGAPQ